MHIKEILSEQTLWNSVIAECDLRLLWNTSQAFKAVKTTGDVLPFFPHTFFFICEPSSSILLPLAPEYMLCFEWRLAF